jgi:hypothetical protein
LAGEPNGLTILKMFFKVNGGEKKTWERFMKFMRLEMG